MIYLVVYDIESDKIRNRLSSWLERKGTRVQESVFECSLEADFADNLANEIQQIIGSAMGNVRIYQVCSNCVKMSWGVGPIVKRPPKKGFDIL